MIKLIQERFNIGHKETVDEKEFTVLRVRSCSFRDNSRKSQGCGCRGRSLGQSHNLSLHGRRRAHRCTRKQSKTIVYRLKEIKEESEYSSSESSSESSSDGKSESISDSRSSVNKSSIKSNILNDNYSNISLLGEENLAFAHLI